MGSVKVKYTNNNNASSRPVMEVPRSLVDCFLVQHNLLRIQASTCLCPYLFILITILKKELKKIFSSNTYSLPNFRAPNILTGKCVIHENINLITDQVLQVVFKIWLNPHMIVFHTACSVPYCLFL